MRDQTQRISVVTRPPAIGALGSGLVKVIAELTHQRIPREKRLRVAQLTSANHSKDAVLAMVSHELRSPLASIQNALQLLGNAALETSARQKTQALLERQVRRMTRLVDDLQDVSRITSGRLHLQHERIDLRVVIKDAIETLMPEINARRHRLTTAFPAAPVWVDGDPCRLEQVFVNLLANAAKYTDMGGDLAVCIDMRGDEAVIRIRDSGIGIAPKALPHVFDLFKQADAADSRSRSGLGIGLAVVRNLVELHGGRVEAASAGLGKGSELTVRLRIEA